MTVACLIKARALVRRFGPMTAVDGISLDVQKGEVLGFLGPNGAGKTTTMKMLTGFLPPTSGTAEICGFDIGKEPLEARKKLGYLPEGAPLYEDMTAAGFLKFIADIRGYRGKARDEKWRKAAEAVHLVPVLDQPIETLSKGYRRRVGLAQAILHDPDVLILDEPTDGLDPNQKHEVRRLIGRMAKEKAIIISTHILEEVEALCSRAVIIDRGKIVADGAPSRLRERSRFNGAVSVQVTAEQLDNAVRRLHGLHGVANVESRIEGAFGQITVFPKERDGLLDEVGAALQSAGIAIRQMALDAGRLDDVFRTLTHSDAATDADRAEEAAA